MVSSNIYMFLVKSLDNYVLQMDILGKQRMYQITESVECTNS